ncbi:hypothetical protein [Endozoicomonas sp. ALC066]|uniref:hypothetical protein n=1 Tax=Endozoicomonas sp. ALC066 TaxID=3403078 RepID=UPI003BB5D1C4
MTKYRDELTELYDREIGSIVGCGLDRLNRDCLWTEVLAAVELYRRHGHYFQGRAAVGQRRQSITDYIQSNGKITPPSDLQLKVEEWLIDNEHETAGEAIQGAIEKFGLPEKIIGDSEHWIWKVALKYSFYPV